MDFLVDLFSGTGGTAMMGILALGIVIVLIVLVVWLFKMLNRFTQKIGRINNKRVNIVDITHIDPKRQLMIIRRDNVEHLLLIGGERDLVIETGFEPPEQIPAKSTKIANGRSKKSPNLATNLSAPIGAVGVKSLRHTGLMKHQEDPILDNNPQTSDTLSKKSEPDFNVGDKLTSNNADSIEEEADVIFSDIEKTSAENNKKRRKSDK